MVARDNVVDLTSMHAILLAVNVEQTFSHFDDHQPGPFDDGSVPEVGGAEVEIAVSIHRAGFQHGDVNRINEASVIIRDFSKIDRNVVTNSSIMFLAIIAGEMPAKPEEVLAFGIRLQNGTRLHGNAGANFDVSEFCLPSGQCLVEDVRLTKSDAVADPIA